MSSEELLKEKILEKKDIHSIDTKIFDKIYEEEKRINIKLFESIKNKKFNSKSKEFKEFIKIIRKKLREIYGVFFKSSLSTYQREKLLEKIDENKTIDRILKSHISTQERYDYFEEMYRKMFLITGIPKKIIDLGCGFNPFAYFKIGKDVEYIASDIGQENLDFIKKFFEKKKIKGTVVFADLTENEDVEKISKLSKDCDICFMFKLLDSLEATKRKTSQKLLDKINSKYIVVSFAKGSISGRNKITSERKWFKRIIEKKYEINKIEIGFEEYFILKKIKHDL